MIAKSLIAESFSKAAPSYDQAAHLQREVGSRLLSFLPAQLQPQQVVDLGCGTGYFTRALQTRFQVADVMGLDIALGMLQYARQHATPGVRWVGGDAERLPLAEGSVDLLFSSLALQWCQNLPGVFAEVRRVLRPGGTFLFTTLAPGTLWELRQAWAAVDTHRHVNEFTSIDQLLQAVEPAGFADVRLEQQELVMEYEDLRQLTGELKQIGAHNLNQDRPSGMTGRQRVQMLRQAYDQLRLANGKLPATWQVVFGLVRS